MSHLVLAATLLDDSGIGEELDVSARAPRQGQRLEQPVVLGDVVGGAPDRPANPSTALPSGRGRRRPQAAGPGISARAASNPALNRSAITASASVPAPFNPLDDETGAVVNAASV